LTPSQFMNGAPPLPSCGSIGLGRLATPSWLPLGVPGWALPLASTTAPWLLGSVSSPVEMISNFSPSCATQSPDDPN
jgi:hypothetical protein